MNKVSTFPHEGACASCREERRCNYCGEPFGRPFCTNGRCAKCHGAVCTMGGADWLGHGFGKQGGEHFTERGA